MNLVFNSLNLVLRIVLTRGSLEVLKLMLNTLGFISPLQCLPFSLSIFEPAPSLTCKH